MLFEDIVHGRESEHEFLLLDRARVEADIEGVELLLGDSLVHVALEAEDFVRDGIEASCSRNLSLILQNDGKDAVAANPGLLELEHWCTISLISVRLLNLESG